MKKLLALVLTTVLCLCTLASCGVLEFHSISYQDADAERLLMDGYAPKRAKPGDTVVLRTGPIMDADLDFYANGVKLENTHNDSDYWEYTFIMPDEDVVITHDIIGGFGPKECINHIDENNDGICDDCNHEHTITYTSADIAGHFENFTCGCPQDFGAVPHYDENDDYICDACGYVMPGHEHTYEYNHDDVGHGWSYTCGCMTPPNFAQHFDGDGDGKCDEDSCGYEYAECDHQWDDGVEIEGGNGGYVMEYTCTLCGYKKRETITIIPEENYFIRNQTGAEWLCEITTEDIAEIKMISGGGGPLPPVSKTHIFSSINDAVISSIFEEYYWLDSKPVSEESTQIADGGYFIVQFILNNGETKQLYFINGDFYHDGNGNYFEIVRLPVFRDGTDFVTRYGFEQHYNPCQIHLIDGTPVCEIPLSEFEFTELTDDIYLDNELPTHYLEINGERVYFIRGEYFYIGDNRGEYYQLIGNLDELIIKYTQ